MVSRDIIHSIHHLLPKDRNQNTEKGDFNA
ncbi:hypothetical protein DespoDRAFT_03489 [Desulfobacter postgatei 2ac9]|uniref:Uncharacterized protein n=1 Tax=Desulfobacter postgatei 2ac9 TaxID=879212 RepID=I5B6Y8_9BACT|nr:hypothetical protein DespoDRAFT_03489 [Desulfobacter postgatei 2ac9]